jgi:Tfp pilus assembly protein PilX
MRRPLAEERGMALVVALMVMILLSLLGVSFLGMSAIENTIAANEVHAAQAFHLAEAGVALANRTLKDSANWTLELAAAQPFPCPVLVPAAFGGCSYRIENDAVDGGGPLVDSNNTVVIRASGQFQTATRQVEVVVSRPNTSLFRNALFAVEYVEL